MPDPERRPLTPDNLETVAQFLDLEDEFISQRTGKHLGNEVQDDLRRWASAIAADRRLARRIRKVTR